MVYKDTMITKGSPYMHWCILLVSILYCNKQHRYNYCQINSNRNNNYIYLTVIAIYLLNGYNYDLVIAVSL